MAKTTRSRTGQAPIRGYDNWTIGEMQRKLGRRSVSELRSLLQYEKGSRKRKGALDAIERALAAHGGPSATEPRRAAKRPAAKAPSPKPEKPSKGLIGGIVERIGQRVSEALGVRPRGALDLEKLLDRLSEFLEHERGGRKLYELGLEKVEDEEQRDRIAEFLEQTRRHEEILTGMIQELGGSVSLLSESAELDRRRSEALFEVDVEGEVGLLTFFQNLVIAELTCQMNWNFLSSALDEIDDEEVRGVLEPSVSEVGDEEDEHFRWAQKQLEACSLALLFPREDAEPDAGREPLGREEPEGGEDEGESEAA
jgi:rubrerythrin